MLHYCDGCILAGGDDVHPSRYHQELHPQTQLEDETIEELEFNIVTTCQQLKIPLLGICRGMQVIAVAYGGTLNQHILHHTQTLHALKETRSFVKGIQQVNSFHHQSCEQLPSSFICCARSDDGTIEAFEGPLTWGVQWHPELQNDDTVLPFFFQQILANKIDKNQDGENHQISIKM